MPLVFSYLLPPRMETKSPNFRKISQLGPCLENPGMRIANYQGIMKRMSKKHIVMGQGGFSFVEMLVVLCIFAAISANSTVWVLNMATSFTLISIYMFFHNYFSSLIKVRHTTLLPKPPKLQVNPILAPFTCLSSAAPLS